MSDSLVTLNLRLVPSTGEEVRAALENMDPAVRAEVSPRWLEWAADPRGNEQWIFGYKLVHQGTGALVGQCGFKGPPDADGMVEIAYGIAPEHQGRGYATEAAEALTRIAFESEVVRVVRAHTLPEANASGRVLTKSGFDKVGEVIEPEDGRVWRWERTRQTIR